MKKLLLSAAIAAAMGTAGVANAAVDLDATTVLPQVFANEAVVVAATTLDVTAAGAAGAGNAAGAAGFVKEFGFTIGQNTSKYVRLDFSHPLAAGLTALTDFSVVGNGNTAQITVSNGGAANDNFVILEVAALTGLDILQDDQFLFTPADDVISAANKADQFIQYRLYETAVDALNQVNTLEDSNTQRWITWGQGYALNCNAPTPGVLQINVVEPTTFVGGGLASNVATLALGVNNVYTTAGAPVAVTDYFGAGAKVAVTGSTEAFETTSGLTLNGVDADAAPADGSALWTATADPAIEFNGAFAVTADGTDPMEQSSYTVAVTGPGVLYDVGTISAACGNLQFSGSTDRLDFALTPGGVFQQMARITNPSNNDGNVTVTVINDDGERATFALGEIANVDSSELAARASTKLININDIYAAAQATNPAFALAAIGPDSKNKLRVVVRGEFGGDAVDFDGTATNTLVERREDGIYIQAVTLSQDSNAFFQTK